MLQITGPEGIHLNNFYKQQLSRLGNSSYQPLLASINRGIERETLRVTKAGTLASTAHPAHLGSKLCHPSITTDFSEAQLELITPVSQGIPETLDYLDEVHRFVYSGLEEEFLWSASMPCELDTDENIPLAEYGNSNLGRLKTTYRRGLGHRYGRIMQTICAIHYNFSLPDKFWEMQWQEEDQPGYFKQYKSRRYFDLMRNFRRFSWLPVYLYGSSPIVASSFITGRKHRLKDFNGASLYSPHATSLRNGDLGYQSDIQASAIQICYNSLDNYVDTLVDAIITPYERYRIIGEKQGRNPLQVNTHILQSEAEFYTTIRAKCVPPPGENFLRELKTRGVDYVEVRLLDVNPYLPMGIDALQLRFLDTLLLYCLLEESPFHDDPLCESVQKNMHEAVYNGRDSKLRLEDNGKSRALGEWGESLLADMKPVAELLDQATASNEHVQSLAEQEKKILDPELTLSARMLADMKMEEHSFIQFGMQKTMEHGDYFQSRPLPDEKLEVFRRMAEESLSRQTEIEAADGIGFDEYLQNIMQGYIELKKNQ